MTHVIVVGLGVLCALLVAVLVALRQNTRAHRRTEAAVRLQTAQAIADIRVEIAGRVLEDLDTTARRITQGQRNV